MILRFNNKVISYRKWSQRDFTKQDAVDQVKQTKSLRPGQRRELLSGGKTFEVVDDGNIKVKKSRLDRKGIHDPRRDTISVTGITKRKNGYQYQVSIFLNKLTVSRRSDKFFKRSEIHKARNEAYRRVLSAFNQEAFGAEYDADEGADVFSKSGAMVKEEIVRYDKAPGSN